MPLTVQQAFDTLVERSKPLGTEIAAAARHKTTIAQGVKNAFPGFLRLDSMGSHTRDSAIKTYSDVDFLAVLAKSDIRFSDGSLKTPQTVLTNLRDALAARFPTTAVKVSTPAVVIQFGGGENSVDVVPGAWESTVSGTDGYPVFQIPDFDGNWNRTAPQRLTKYCLDNGYGKLPVLMRIIKRWKYSRGQPIPISSLHCEMLLAASGHCNAVASYRQLFRDALKLIVDWNGSGLKDPLGIGNAISLAPTKAQRDQVLSDARYGLDHSDSALSAEARGNTDEAFRQWDLVFNGQFPSR